MAYTRTDSFVPSPPFNYSYTGYENMNCKINHLYNIELYIRDNFHEYNVAVMCLLYSIIICCLLYILIKDLYDHIMSLRPEPELDEPMFDEPMFDQPMFDKERASRKRKIEDDTQEAIKRRKESLRSFAKY